MLLHSPMTVDKKCSNTLDLVNETQDVKNGDLAPVTCLVSESHDILVNDDNETMELKVYNKCTHCYENFSKSHSISLQKRTTHINEEAFQCHV